MRAHLRTAVVALLGVILLALFLRNANLREVWTEVTRARIDLVLVAVALTASRTCFARCDGSTCSRRSAASASRTPCG